VDEPEGHRQVKRRKTGALAGELRPEDACPFDVDQYVAHKHWALRDANNILGELSISELVQQRYWGIVTFLGHNHETYFQMHDILRNATYCGLKGERADNWLTCAIRRRLFEKGVWNLPEWYWDRDYNPRDGVSQFPSWNTG
jgi:hypothetical protein